MKKVIVALLLMLVVGSAFAEVSSKVTYWQDKGELQVNCTGLRPNSEYAFLLVETCEGEINAVSMGNLLRVGQLRASANGTLRVSVIDRDLPECAVLIGGDFNGVESPYLAGSYPPSGETEEPSGIRLPSALRQIEAEAFAGCTFNYVYLGDSISVIGSRAFADCAELLEITIPDSVEEIADDAFEGSPFLTIICPEKSCAHTYAIEHSIDYILK